MASGGPWESVVLNNRRFPIDGEANVMVSQSGYTNEIKVNGDKTVRQVKTAKAGKVKGLVLEIDNARGDNEFLQEIMDSSDFVAFYGTGVDGTVWEGTVQISGDPEKSEKEGTMEIEVHGTIRRQGA